MELTPVMFNRKLVHCKRYDKGAKQKWKTASFRSRQILDLCWLLQKAEFSTERV